MFWWLFLGFSQFDGSFHCFKFDKFPDIKTKTEALYISVRGALENLNSSTRGGSNSKDGGNYLNQDGYFVIQTSIQTWHWTSKVEFSSSIKRNLCLWYKFTLRYQCSVTTYSLHFVYCCPQVTNEIYAANPTNQSKPSKMVAVSNAGNRVQKRHRWLLF